MTTRYQLMMRQSLTSHNGKHGPELATTLVLASGGTAVNYRVPPLRTYVSTELMQVCTVRYSGGSQRVHTARPLDTKLIIPSRRTAGTSRSTTPVLEKSSASDVLATWEKGRKSPATMTTTRSEMMDGSSHQTGSWHFRAAIKSAGDARVCFRCLVCLAMLIVSNL